MQKIEAEVTYVSMSDEAYQMDKTFEDFFRVNGLNMNQETVEA